jgi:hypothetical protein
MGKIRSRAGRVFVALGIAPRLPVPRHLPLSSTTGSGEEAVPLMEGCVAHLRALVVARWHDHLHDLTTVA